MSAIRAPKPYRSNSTTFKGDQQKKIKKVWIPGCCIKQKRNESVIPLCFFIIFTQ